MDCDGKDEAGEAGEGFLYATSTASLHLVSHNFSGVPPVWHREPQALTRFAL